MPVTYPAGAPSLSGDTLSISRFLSDPARLQRRLRSFRDLRFVSDQILTQRFRSSGGAVLYEMSEPFVSTRSAESVAAGSEYPYAALPTGTAAVAAIQKWGLKTKLTDEEIARTALAGDALDRALQKVINSIIKQVDTITMSAVASAITATAATSGSWDNATVANRAPLLDILKAQQAINELNLGYKADTLVVSDKAFTYLMVNADIAAMRQREVSNNPIYTGLIDNIAGLTVVVTPNLPTPTTAIILDSTQLGGMADETEGSPGYSVADLAVQVKSIRREGQDAWDLQGRRKTVPIVQEPGAGYEVTGVVS